MSNKQKGIMFIILSALSFGLMNIFVRLSGDLPSMQKSFFRNFIAMIIAAMVLIKEKEGFHYKKADLPLLILRASFGTIGILGNFYAVDHMLLADASALQKLSPFVVIICSHFLLKEKASTKQILMVLIAFVGSLFVVKPSFQADLLPALVAIIGAIGAGVAYTMVRMLTQRGVSKSKIVFFFSTFSCLVVLPFVIVQYEPMTATQIIYLLLAGVFAACGQFAVTTAYGYAPSKEISVFDYTQIIFMAILSFFIFGQVPDLYSFIGYIIIILCGYCNYRYTNKLEEA